MKTITSIIALSTLLAATSAGFAGSQNGTLQVKINVTSGCVINANAGSGVTGGTAVLDFGDAGVFTTNIDRETSASGAGAVQVICTAGQAYNVGLDAGLKPGTAGDVSTRRMTNGPDLVTYQLYQDAGRTKVWGNTRGINTIADTADGTNKSYQVFGQVPPQAATPKTGTYTDTVAISVVF